MGSWSLQRHVAPEQSELLTAQTTARSALTSSPFGAGALTQAPTAAAEVAVAEPSSSYWKAVGFEEGSQ